MMTSNTVLSIATCVLFVVVIVLNYVATSETIGAVAFTNSQVADTHPVYGLPNGWAFAIWGIIFIFLGVYTIYQALPAKYYGGFECELVARVRVPALGMMILNSFWNFLFGWESYWMALLDIVLYDALLFVCIRRCGVNYFTPIVDMTRQQALRTKICLVAPFSIHAGWVTVATTLNVQVNLLEAGWMPSPDFSVFACWTAVAIGLVLTIFRNADLPYTIVTLWALGGIVSNQADGSTWGCASRICGTCVEATLPICSRSNSASAYQLANGWGDVDCSPWANRTGTGYSGVSESQASNDLACGITIVPKSSAVIGWSVGGMVFVACAFLAAAIMVNYFPEYYAMLVPAEPTNVSHKKAEKGSRHSLEDGHGVPAVPDTKSVMVHS